MRKAFVLAGKDLRSELRGNEIALPMIVFGVILVFLLTFAFPPGAGRAPIPAPRAGAVASREVAAAFLWAAFLFAAIVGFGRNASLETEGERIEGLLMTPVDPALLFAGKAMGNFVYLCVMEIVMIPIFMIFFDVPPGLLFPEVLPVAVAANLGLAAVGTLFAAASQYARVKEVALPLLAFPILLPVVLAATKLTSSLLVLGGFYDESRWFILLAAFDASVLSIGAVTFEYVIRE